VTDKQIDDATGTETTGHEWDGIKELNTPLPRWWLWTFYACIVFAMGYTIFYPAWPITPGSATNGTLGYTGRGELQAELADAQKAQSKYADQIAVLPVAQVEADPDLAKFATAAGRSLFKVNCAQCHGTGAAGAPGYPNLNDDDWIFGGSIDQIYNTISHGSRSAADPDTHVEIMPNFGSDAMLTREQIATVAEQVASFTGLEGGQSTSAGQQLFADNCAGCHGESGQGNPDMGAPALNDRIWLYEGSLAAIQAQINHPRLGIMPAWGPRLGDTAVKELAIYVHGLGGGK
jgi:cytochrome c oxidase cbb3-type subunit 3